MKILILILSLLSFSAFAGFKKGNGGNSLICSDSTGLLDFYEGEILYRYHPETSTKDWRNILEEKIHSLALYSSETTQTYKKWLAEFDRDALFLKNVSLGNINDSLHVVIPEGCVAQQTVNQQLNPLPAEKRYWISANIWDKLSNVDKAGLIFHEFTYRKLQEEDSRNTRKITAFLFSTEFSQSSAEEIRSVLRSLGF